jgi:hypothetical protein
MIMFNTSERCRVGSPHALITALGFPAKIPNNTVMKNTPKVPHRSSLMNLLGACGLMIAVPLACFAADPVASYSIKYSNNFDSNMDGMYRSPGDLPVDRVQRVQDPLGQRGGVLRVIWKEGDNYRTSENTAPRSWVSNKAFYFQGGQTVSYAWGVYAPSIGLNTSMAQNISNGGPCWMLQVDGSGYVWMAANGRTNINFRLPTGRWTDFKTEFNLQSSNTGWLKLYVNGSQKYYKSSLGFGSTKASTTTANCHWDGGIYGYMGSGTAPTRTVYIGNLSVGRR